MYEDLLRGLEQPPKKVEDTMMRRQKAKGTRQATEVPVRQATEVPREPRRKKQNTPKLFLPHNKKLASMQEWWRFTRLCIKAAS
jgi:hypothetical protein